MLLVALERHLHTFARVWRPLLELLGTFFELLAGSWGALWGPWELLGSLGISLGRLGPVCWGLVCSLGAQDGIPVGIGELIGGS